MQDGSSQAFEVEVLRKFKELETQVNRCHASLYTKLENLAKSNGGYGSITSFSDADLHRDHLSGFLHVDGRAIPEEEQRSELPGILEGERSDPPSRVGSKGKSECKIISEDLANHLRSHGNDPIPGPTSRDSSILPQAWEKNSNSNSNSTGQHSGSVEQNMFARKTLSRKIWNFLENPDSSLAAKVYDTIQPYFLFATVIFTLAQTVKESPVSETVCRCIEILVDVSFVSEIIVRFVVSPIRGVSFFLDFFNIIDILTTVPLFFRVPVLIFSTRTLDRESFLLCAVGIVRLLKMMRRFRKIHLLLEAFQLAFEALPVLMFTLFFLVLFFASLVYLLEPDGAPISSLSQSIWFTVVTMTTVGYGDIVPVSTPGTCIVTVLAVSSVLYMAMPLGIVGHAFTQVWLDRDRILLVKKMKDVLRQWGYTAFDVPLLFAIFDSSGVGQLNITDFRKMLNQMQLGLSNSRACELFHTMDKRSNGYIEDRELVRHVFPDKYHEVYGDDLVAESTTKCSCGNLVMLDAKFCRKCGKKVSHSESADETEENKDKKEKKKKDKQEKAKPVRAVARQCSCGNLLMPDASFCRKCGRDASEANHVRASEFQRRQRVVITHTTPPGATPLNTSESSILRSRQSSPQSSLDRHKMMSQVTDGSENDMYRQLTTSTCSKDQHQVSPTAPGNPVVCSKVRSRDDTMESRMARQTSPTRSQTSE